MIFRYSATNAATLALMALLISEVHGFSPVVPRQAAAAAAASFIDLGSSPRSLVLAPSSSATTCLYMAKDWDAILKQAEEEEDAEDSFGDLNAANAADVTTTSTTASNIPIPTDMEYNQRNCQRQQRHYQAIREIADPDLVHDVYIRDPRDTTDVYWFIGKAARVSDVSVDACISRQWNLIETHAVNLRPMDLFKAKGDGLELWIAPGDSELEVAYNRPNMRLQKIHRIVDGSVDDIPNVMIGFQGEVYDPGEPGFRTWRLPDGSPARPEITGPQEQQLQEAAQKLQQQPPATSSMNIDGAGETEYRAPSDDEMEKLKEALKEQDIEAMWRDQQRREGKEIDDDDE